MIDEVVPVTETLADLPLVLFGHSMGALLAFEVARKLEAAGCSPALLIVSGARAPSRASSRRVSHLPDDIFAAELAKLDGTPAEVFQHRELLEVVLPIVRGDIALVESGDWDRYAVTGIDLVALGGRDDPHVRLDHLHAWEAHTSGRFERRVFPGGHFFIHTLLDVVAAEVAARCAAVVGRTRSVSATPRARAVDASLSARVAGPTAED